MRTFFRIVVIFITSSLIGCKEESNSQIKSDGNEIAKKDLRYYLAEIKPSKDVTLLYCPSTKVVEIQKCGFSQELQFWKKTHCKPPYSIGDSTSMDRYLLLSKEKSEPDHSQTLWVSVNDKGQIETYLGTQKMDESNKPDVSTYRFGHLSLNRQSLTLEYNGSKLALVDGYDYELSEDFYVGYNYKATSVCQVRTFGRDSFVKEVQELSAQIIAQGEAKKYYAPKGTKELVERLLREQKERKAEEKLAEQRKKNTI